MIQRGEIWWARLPTPTGSGPGYRRPVVVVQADSFNRSRIGTIVVLAITSNIGLAAAPGNVLLAPKASGLPRRSVANVTQVLTLDRSLLTKRIRMLSASVMSEIEVGLKLVLDL